MRAFLESGVSDEARARHRRALERLGAFRRSLVPPVKFAELQLPHLLDFLHGLFQQELAPSTVQAYGCAIDQERRRRGLPPLLVGVDYAAFVRAMKVSRPTGSKFVGVVPYAPRSLVPFLLDVRKSGFRALRERCVFLLRVDTLMRPGEVSTVLRSTIRAVRDPAQRRCVVFNYSSKQSRRRHVATDSNYCSHACDPGQGGLPVDLCPACVLLKMKAAIDALPGAAAHDRITTDSDGNVLSIDRSRALVNDLLRRAEVPAVFTAHSLRGAANQALLLAGVDPAVVAVRAGWAGPLSDAQRRHYTHHRFVAPVFASILLR